MRPQRGVTLVEMMIALTLGLLVVLFASTLLLASHGAYTAQTQAASVDDAARFALAAIEHAARQSAYVDWERSDAGSDPDPASEPPVHGLDAASLVPAAHALNDPRPAAINGSDILALRFSGAGPDEGDGSVTTCAGFSVGAGQQGWSIFYVGLSAGGRAELRCKYQGTNNWSADAVVGGVDSFQVLYGVDTDAVADGVANSFLSASAVNEMDRALAGEGETAAERERDRLRKSWWRRVASIKVALILHAEGALDHGDGPRMLHAFGNWYSQVRGDSDTGTRLDRDAMDPSLRQRAHRVFSATILLRNRTGPR
ncbi:MAG TPA: PilW family protein [Telluria sp.]|jgi:type IV pilus assembly protein PilW